MKKLFCPICHKAAMPDMLPFCSKRCADVDLGRWFGAGYTIPVVELDDVDMDALLDEANGEDEDQ